MTPLPRPADLLRAGERLIRRLPGSGAALHAMPGGFRYASADVVLDLTRYGIMLRKSPALSPTRQAEILAIIATIADDLGFANPGSDEDPGFPSPGSAFAIHPALAALDARITEDMQLDPPDESGDGLDVEP